MNAEEWPVPIKYKGRTVGVEYGGATFNGVITVVCKISPHVALILMSYTYILHV